jgi:hypothetical protein
VLQAQKTIIYQEFFAAMPIGLPVVPLMSFGNRQAGGSGCNF